MDRERWRDVVGFEGQYQVSDLGRVRSLDRNDSAGRARKGRVLRPSMVMGYPFVNLSKNGEHHVIRVHVLVAEAFLGPRPDGFHVNHKNCDKTDNCPANLEYVTPGENVRHAMLHGRLHGLSRTQIQAIRYIYQRNRTFPVEMIASKFEVDPATIINVISARTHTEIPNIDGSPVIPLERSLSADAVVVLRAAGFEAREIAYALDIEYSTAFQSLNRAGIYHADTLKKPGTRIRKAQRESSHRPDGS